MTIALVEHQLVLDALCIDSDGGVSDELVRSMILGCSIAIDNRCGHMVSRPLATLAESTTPTLTLDTSTTGQALSELQHKHCGRAVTVGTEEDPWRHVPFATVGRVEFSPSRVVLSGYPESADIPAGAELRSGRFATTADVPEDVRLAAMHVIRNRWANEHGAASGTYDNESPAGGSPFIIPWMALELLGDYLHLGIA